MKATPILAENQEVHHITYEIKFLETHILEDGMIWGRLMNGKVYCKSALSEEMLDSSDELLVPICEDILENIEHQLESE